MKATPSSIFTKLIFFACLMAAASSIVLFLQDNGIGGITSGSLALCLSLVFEGLGARRDKSYRKRCFWGAAGFGIVFLFFLSLIIF